MTISLQVCCSSVILEHENTTDWEDKFFTLACLYLTRDPLTSTQGVGGGGGGGVSCQHRTSDTITGTLVLNTHWNSFKEGGKKQNPRWSWHPKGTATKYSMSIWKLILFEKPKSSGKILSLNKLLWHDARKRLPHNQPLLARVTEHLGRSVYWKWSHRQQNWATRSWSSQMRSPINSPCWVDSLLGNIGYHKKDSKI